MSTLPNIRVNVRAPFPTLVYGTGPVLVTKANGIWTVGFSIAQLSLGTPVLANYPNCYLVYWDASVQMFLKLPLSSITSLVANPPQRSITTSGNLPITSSDAILNINAVSDLTPAIPLASSRNGAPLRFKNLPGSHLQTLTASGSDTFDGQATYPLGAGAGVQLRPYNDGVNSGYSIE